MLSCLWTFFLSTLSKIIYPRLVFRFIRLSLVTIFVESVCTRNYYGLQKSILKCLELTHRCLMHFNKTWSIWFQSTSLKWVFHYFFGKLIASYDYDILFLSILNLFFSFFNCSLFFNYIFIFLQWHPTTNLFYLH